MNSQLKNQKDRIPAAEWNRRCEANTTQLREAVKELEKRFERGDRQLRDEVQKVAGLFRSLKPLDREEQPRLWEQFNTLRDRMRQERESFQARQEENARRLEEAIKHLENQHSLSWLNEIARDASRLMAMPEGERVDFGAIWRDTKDVQELFKQCKPLRRDEHDRLWNRLNRFRDRVREFQNLHRSRYDDDCKDNYNRIYNAIQELQSTYNLGWGQSWCGQGSLKGFSADAREVAELFKTCKPLRKDQREELWNFFNKVRDKANEARDLLQEQWRNGQRERIQHFHSLVEKNEDYIAHLQGQIEANEERRDSARSFDFANTVQGWIDEKRDKIREVEARNSELLDKIADMERRLER